MWSTIWRTVAIKTVGHLLHRLRDKLAADPEQQKTQQQAPGKRTYPWKRHRVKACIALALVTLTLSGCSAKRAFVEWYDAVIGHSDETATATPLVVVYDQTEAQELANKSPRISNKTLPAGAPTIKITGYTWGSGSITFESATCGAGHVPEGYEYLFIFINAAGKVENAAASHGTRDGRAWDKAPEPIAFMVVLVKDGRSVIVEYSEVKHKP